MDTHIMEKQTSYPLDDPRFSLSVWREANDVYSLSITDTTENRDIVRTEREQRGHELVREFSDASLRFGLSIIKYLQNRDTKEPVTYEELERLQSQR